MGPPLQRLSWLRFRALGNSRGKAKPAPMVFSVLPANTYFLQLNVVTAIKVYKGLGISVRTAIEVYKGLGLGLRLM